MKDMTYKINSCTGILSFFCEPPSNRESSKILSQLALKSPEPRRQVGQSVSCGQETGIGLVQSCVGLGRERGEG